MRRRRADTEQTRPIKPLPRDGDLFWRLTLDQQRALVEYLDHEQEQQRL